MVFSVENQKTDRFSKKRQPLISATDSDSKIPILTPNNASM
jgi:hypothetical protein